MCHEPIPVSKTETQFKIAGKYRFFEMFTTKRKLFCRGISNVDREDDTLNFGWGEG